MAGHRVGCKFSCRKKSAWNIIPGVKKSSWNGCHLEYKAFPIPAHHYGMFLIGTDEVYHPHFFVYVPNIESPCIIYRYLISFFLN